MVGIWDLYLKDEMITWHRRAKARIRTIKVDHKENQACIYSCPSCVDKWSYCEQEHALPVRRTSNPKDISHDSVARKSNWSSERPILQDLWPLGWRARTRRVTRQRKNDNHRLGFTLSLMCWTLYGQLEVIFLALNTYVADKNYIVQASWICSQTHSWREDMIEIRSLRSSDNSTLTVHYPSFLPGSRCGLKIFLYR